jgi:hypothetical protein
VDTTIRKQTQITWIRQVPSYKQLGVKTNRTLFFFVLFCGNRNGHHNSWFTVQYRLVWLYWVCVPHLFSLVCCPIICLYVVSSVLWCPLRFPQNNTKKNNVRFVFTPSCLYEGSVFVDHCSCFFLFLLTVLLFVRIRFMASDYYFGIFQLFLSKYYQLIIFNNLVIFVTATI